MSTKISKRKELSRNAGGGTSPAQAVRSNNRWREAYNPLRGLVMARVVSMLEAGERGEFADLQWLYRMVEKRFAVLRSLVARRRAALLKLDWDIKVVSELPKGATEAQAEAQRDFLRARYEGIGNLREAIKFLGLAEFRGFSILQKHKGSDGRVQELHWLPQWNFVRDGLLGDFYWNEAGQSGATALALGEANRIGDGGGLDPREFIIRVEEMPIDEIGVIAFVRSNLSQKDWDAFVELFGLPGCVVIMPPNMPAGKEGEYRDAAQDVAEGASGALPNGADAKFPSGGARAGGGGPFKEHLEAQEKDVVLAGTGGKLAMLTANTGLGSNSQGEEHADAFDEVAQGEAKEISEIFQKQFDAVELESAFPGQPRLAYFELAAQDQEDVDAVVTRVVALEGAGFETDTEEVSEKTGLKLGRREATEGTEITEEERNGFHAETRRRGENGKDGRIKDQGLGTKDEEEGKVKNRSEVQRVAGAVAADLAPVAERLERILGIEDPEIFRGKLAEFAKDLEQLKKDVGADPRLASEVEGILARGIAGKYKG